MTAPSIHGAEHDLAVIREVRDRILAGDWTQGSFVDDEGRKCLTRHMTVLSPWTHLLLKEHIDVEWVSVWNDTHTQAEAVALLDDVEDSLLGELGVEG